MELPSIVRSNQVAMPVCCSFNGKEMWSVVILLFSPSNPLEDKRKENIIAVVVNKLME